MNGDIRIPTQQSRGFQKPVTAGRWKETERGRSLIVARDETRENDAAMAHGKDTRANKKFKEE
ncbi:MAG: hypothetical protein ACM3UW_03895 [Bacillota bacterium]